MGWFRDHRFGISVGTFLIFASLLALVLGYVGITIASAWTFGGSVVGVLGNLAMPFLPIIAILLIATVVSGVSFGWAVLRRLSIPRSERLHSAAERIERSNSVLGTLSLSDFVAPEQSDEDALETLKQQYVAGEIDEEEFERQLDRLTTESHDNTYSSSVQGSRKADREW